MNLLPAKYGPVSGATLAHNQIVQNLSGLLRRDFRPKGCRVYTETVKLQTDAFAGTSTRT